ncbi:MAG: diguanylate cyclase [Gammaproteobacteria bacterium]|nr:diguanylate cyclase [Gammaproteobacteria bacterium]
MSLNQHSHWEVLTASMSDGFFVTQDFKIVYLNPACERLLGAQPGELTGHDFLDYVHPDMREMIRTRHQNRVQGLSTPRHYELLLLCADGRSTVEAWVEIDTILDQNQQIAVAGTVRDIGSFKALKQELEQTRAQLSSIMDKLSDTIYQTNMNGEITLISDCVRSLLGYRAEQMLGTKMANYYWSPAEREKVVHAIVQNNGVITNVEAMLKRKDGSAVWISTNAYVKKNEQGEAISIEGVARDVTRQKELELKLERLALTDSLTSLPNRRALLDELESRFSDAQQNTTELSLFYFDVNEFKSVNDQFGHLVGDQLLLHIARTLQAYVQGEMLFGRLSGDEFLFILPGFSAQQAREFAARIFDDLQHHPLKLDAVDIPISLSMGISCLSSDDLNEYSLLDRADQAMFAAKRGSRQIELL